MLVRSLWMLILLVALLAGCRPPRPTRTPIRTPATTLSVTPKPSPVATRTPRPSPAPTQPATPTPTPTAYPVTGELTFQVVAQRGGGITGVAVEGSVAYVGLGPRLAALDVSDPAAPQLISQSEVLPGRVSAVLVQDSVAYLGAGRYALTLDVSLSGDLARLDAVALPGAITHAVLGDEVWYVGGAIYAGNFANSGFVGTVAVTEPDRLAVLDWVGTPEQVSGLALAGETLFVGQPGDHQGIYTLDTADPTRLAQPELRTALDPYTLRVIGNRLYVGGFMRIRAFDLTDPHNPEPVWEVKRTEALPLGVVSALEIQSGRMIALGLQPAGSPIPFREVVAPPEPIGGAAGAPVASLAAVTRGHLLMSGMGNGALEIYALGPAGQFSLRGRYRPDLPAVSELAVSGDSVSLLEHPLSAGASIGRLHVLQLPDLRSQGVFTATGSEARTDWFSALTVADGRAYLAARDGLWVLDVGTPAAPTLLGRPDLGVVFDPDAAAPVVVDGRLYLAVGHEGFLLAVDLRAVDHPRVISRPQPLPGGTIRALAVGEGRLYAVTEDEESDWFHVLALTEGGPSLQGSLQLPGRINALAAVDAQAVLVGSEGLHVISAAQPERPVALAEVPLPGDGYGLAVEGGLAFVSVGGHAANAWLLAFDLRDPADPRAVGALDIPALGRVAAAGEYVVVADSAMGVYVLEYRQGARAFGRRNGAVAMRSKMLWNSSSNILI